MEHTYAQDAKVFKAFCDENRLLILEMLRSGEKCACKLVGKSGYRAIDLITPYENSM